MKPEQEQLQNLICETITMLCKNGLSYKSELKVQGLVAVTVDNSDVFIVHLNERLEDAVGGFVIPVDRNGLVNQQPSSCSGTSKQHHPDTAQNYVNSTIDQFELFTGRTEDAVSNSVPAETGIDEESSCMILKVEPLTDEGEAEHVDATDFVAKGESMNVDGEVDGRAFKVGLPCSSSQNVPEVVDYRFLRESNSSVLEVSRKDMGSDAKAAVALVSTSVRSCARDPVPIQKGSVQHSAQTFPNVLPNVNSVDPGLASMTDNSHAKIPLPKLMRGYLPIMPGFASRQQAISKGERPFLFLSQRQTSRLPRRPRESTEKHFICPFCGLSYYYKKHLKFHLRQKHGF